jgi:tRNA modification GTPase
MEGYLPELRRAEGGLSSMLATHDRGRVLRSGVPTAIIGRPNTGKSSLLNAFVGFERAIVTDIAGTTRDTIEEKVVIGDVLLRLIDTAGLRKVSDTIEKLGVGRALAALDNAGLAIVVLDGSEPLQNDDYEALARVPQGIPALIAVNKSDLPPVLDDGALGSLGFPFCRVSALFGDGIEALGAEVGKLFPGFGKRPGGEIVTNERQAEVIGYALESVRQAISATCAPVTPDAVLCEVESALEAIGEATGKVMREDVVARIFERFCVGK